MTDVVKQECEDAARVCLTHAVPEDDDTVPEHVQQLYSDSSKDLTEPQRITLRNLLREYSSIVQTSAAHAS